MSTGTMKYADLSLGTIEAVVNKLGGMEGVERFLRGEIAVAEPAFPIIDCDADPFTPDGWKVEEHRKGGQFVWNPDRITLYLSANQQNGKTSEGNKLRKELAKQSVLNACILDFLLAHPELIPEDWKGKAIFFWGTIYRRTDGNLYVRYLCWDGDRWSRHCFWLEGGFDGRDPAAVSAS